MAMRETVGSLRAYFIVIAILSGYGDVMFLRGGAQGIVRLTSLVFLGFAVAYFYLGVRLKQLLVTSPGQVKGVLIATAVFLPLMTAFDMVSRLRGLAYEVWRLGVGLLVTWYLFRSVKRLATHSSSTVPATPSRGRVV